MTVMKQLSNENDKRADAECEDAERYVASSEQTKQEGEGNGQQEQLDIQMHGDFQSLGDRTARLELSFHRSSCQLQR